MSIELTVIIKDEERTYRHKFLVYESFSMHADDPVIVKCIEETMKNFEGETFEDISVKTTMVLK